jgi:hypothetical protein
MKTTILNDTIPWSICIIKAGDSYGLNGCMVYDGYDPLIEFYDRRPLDRPNPNFEEPGQFVSRYYASTILEHSSEFGLNLDMGIADWSISPEGMVTVRDFIQQNLARAA